MGPFEVKEIERVVGGVWWNPREGAPPVTDISTDSRKLSAGCLFIPLRGENFDGHTFIDAALDAGAAGTVCARLPAALRPDKFYIKVDDTRPALRALAKAYRERFSIPFIQITGSVGKTTAKEMLAAVLSTRLRTLKTLGSLNNDIGVPLTLFRLTEEHQAAVIETGMNHFGEIRQLGAMVLPDIAVITNIGDAHIEFLGSREGILKAKSEIFENLKPGGAAVLNGDDALLDTLAPPFETIRCGKSAGCDVRILDIEDRGVEGIVCDVRTKQAEYRLTVPAPGEHMAYPASMAAAIGERLGLGRDEIVRGVAAYEPTGSRMRLVRLPGDRTILDDCYNASPQSVAAALEILAKTACDRKIAVLGDMGELGSLTEQAHYNMGALAAMLGIDETFAIGEKAVGIAQGAADSGGEARHYADMEEALPDIRERFGENTVVLVKASHAMRFGRLVEALTASFS